MKIIIIIIIIIIIVIIIVVIIIIIIIVIIKCKYVYKHFYSNTTESKMTGDCSFFNFLWAVWTEKHLMRFVTRSNLRFQIPPA